MTQEGFKRKLAAILSADVKEYSRHMREAETTTIRTLTEYRQAMATLINQHHGRVVDSVGDNLLAEFASVVDAVQGAIAIQKEVTTRNVRLPLDRRMVFRIGINLGDIVIEGDRIYGDGVNIAARLESMADPGGICISRTAYDQIEDKLPLGYEYLGEKTLKDSTKPIRAYKVLFELSEKRPTHLQNINKRWFKRKAKKNSETTNISPEASFKHRDSLSFYKHKWLYVGVIGFLFIINILTWPGVLWVIWPTLGWGLLLFLHWKLSSKPSSKDK